MYKATLMLSCSFTPSAVLAVLPLVLSPRELTPLLLGGPVCAWQAISCCIFIRSGCQGTHWE